MTRQFAVTALFTIALALLASGCSDPLYSRDVTGQVSKDPTSRIKSGTSTVQEKISITLSPYEADDVLVTAAGGPSGLVIECLSTKCAQVTTGMCIALQCKQVVNWTEPNVVECKMDKEIECTEAEDAIEGDAEDAGGDLWDDTEPGEDYGDGAGENCPDEETLATSRTCRYVGCLKPGDLTDGPYPDIQPCLIPRYWDSDDDSTSNWNGLQLGEPASAGDC